MLEGGIRLTFDWLGFYINLPFGGIVIVTLIFLLHVPNPAQYKGLTIQQQIERLDPVGTLLFVSGVICLLLALQWGGIEHAWSSAQVIVCLVLAGVLLIAFMTLQVWLDPGKATLPLRIIKQRSVASAIWFTFCLGSSMMVIVYYISIWFQAIKGVSAVGAGLRMLALVLPLVAGSVLGGLLTNRTGFYSYAIIASSVTMTVGTALLTTWKVDTAEGNWIGFQCLAGFGIGLGMQQPNLAMQTILARPDVGIGTSLVFFAQTLGGAVFISVAQNVFASDFAKTLAGIQDTNPAVLVNAGATSLRALVKPAHLPAVLQAYNSALVKTFIVASSIAGLSLIGALAMEWKSIKKGEGQGATNVADAEPENAA